MPSCVVRRSAYIAPGVILMPSFVNIGAYVDEGSMVDGWATVGSCAQIGKNVHLSGGVGIGGVLEPLQANPTIIEDGCFVGARSEIVEGVVVERGAVISMGVYIGQTTSVISRSDRSGPSKAEVASRNVNRMLITPSYCRNLVGSTRRIQAAVASKAFPPAVTTAVTPSSEGETTVLFLAVEARNGMASNTQTASKSRSSARNSEG